MAPISAHTETKPETGGRKTESNVQNSLIMPATPDGTASMKAVRVAILFNRFGPYHHARLNAAGRWMSVWGLEACAMEATYAWDKIDGASGFTRVTLTDYYTGDRRWKQEYQGKLWRLLDEIKPQVVFIPGWIFADALCALWWCVTKKIPAVVMSESTAWDESRNFFKEGIKSRLVKMCAAGLAGGTPHADYLKQLGLPEDSVSVGYDVVDNEYFAARNAEILNQKEKIRGELGLPENYFLASARFVEKKNITRLLQAYARYRQLFSESERSHPGAAAWPLILLGDGPLRATLESQIAQLDLGNHVRLPGFKQYEELPAYYGLASAFIHASTTEQWGLVVNEAMASGLPVLVSNRCGCAPDLVAEGVNGFTFDPLDSEAMAQRMLKVSIQSAELLAGMGAASRRIVANWGPERFANGVREAVAVALKNPHPTTGLLDRLLLKACLSR